LLAGFGVLLLVPLFKEVVGKVDASPSILLLLARPFIYTKIARRFAILHFIRGWRLGKHIDETTNPVAAYRLPAQD
jgi:hypothetical protein